MKTIQPEFSDSVLFYLIGTDPSEDLEKLTTYRDKNEYPWPIAYPSQGTLKSLRVVSQASKIAIDADGVITYRDGYGRGSDQAWKEVFEGLASQ